MKRPRTSAPLAHSWLALVCTLVSAGLAPGQGTIVHIVPLATDRLQRRLAKREHRHQQRWRGRLYLVGGQDVDLNPLNNNAVISVPEPPGELGDFIYAFSQGAPISSSLAPGSGVVGGERR